MKHILEEKVSFYRVIVRTFWMTLVHLTKVLNGQFHASFESKIGLYKMHASINKP